MAAGGEFFHRCDRRSPCPEIPGNQQGRVAAGFRGRRSDGAGSICGHAGIQNGFCPGAAGYPDNISRPLAHPGGPRADKIPAHEQLPYLAGKRGRRPAGALSPAVILSPLDACLAFLPCRIRHGPRPGGRDRHGITSKRMESRCKRPIQYAQEKKDRLTFSTPAANQKVCFLPLLTFSTKATGTPTMEAISLAERPFFASNLFTNGYILVLLYAITCSFRFRPSYKPSLVCRRVGYSNLCPAQDIFQSTVE